MVLNYVLVGCPWRLDREMRRRFILHETILGDPGAVSRDDRMLVVEVYCKIETIDSTHHEYSIVPTNCPWVSEDDTKQDLLAEGFLLPTLSTSILFTRFWIDLVLATTGNTSAVAGFKGLDFREITSLPEIKNWKWFTWHVTSVIAESKSHAHHKTTFIQWKFTKPNHRNFAN